MKRFWASTQVAALPNGFLVQLDGKPVKLPGGAALSVPFRLLADEIAKEWAAIRAEFTPDDLPLTRLLATAQHRVLEHRNDIIQQLTEFGLHDLLCYRAAGPPALTHREAETWQPWIEWAHRKLGIDLKVTTGIAHIEQSEPCRTGFVRLLSRMTEYQLAGLGVIVPALGSLVLGLAVEADALTVEAACECAHMDEIWQEQQWGSDEPARARRDSLSEDVAVSMRFMRLCRP